jgi:hypothetical protein
MRIHVIVVAGGLALGAHAADEWFAGRYQGSISFADSSFTLRLECAPQMTCALRSIEARKGEMPQGTDTTYGAVATRADLAPMRAALRYAREHKADTIAHEEYAAIHAALRPVLDSPTDVDACVDLDGSGNRDVMVVCRMAASPWGEPAVLLFGALAASCGHGFCGYVIYPLRAAHRSAS